jgi:hypothetical protein
VARVSENGETHEGRDAVDFIEALALAGAKESNKIVGFCGSLDRPLKDVRELGYLLEVGDDLWVPNVKKKSKRGEHVLCARPGLLAWLVCPRW